MNDLGRRFTQYLAQHKLELTRLGHYRKSGRKSKTSEVELLKNNKVVGHLVSNPYGGTVTWGVYIYNSRGELVVKVEDVDESGYVKLRQDLLELAKSSQDEVVRASAFAIHILMYTNPSKAYKF